MIVMVTPGQSAGFSESGWWHLVQRLSEVEVLRFSDLGFVPYKKEKQDHIPPFSIFQVCRGNTASY